MELPGVGGVFLAPDFISVTKTEGEWQHLRPAVLGVVTEFFLTGAPALSGEPPPPATSSSTGATPRPSRRSRS